ncbi:hypothetical protein KM043_007790 [Ampulex compressa]|nr:hypothetical protein KM043_007790 [Ampulex compressa]
MRALLCILLIHVIPSKQYKEEFCSLNDGESCVPHQTHNKYTRDENKQYEKYIRIIQDAEENYKSCNNTNCECYTNVIMRDLKPFKKKRISRQLINTAKSRGTFYQVIDNKLYREKDCMFPSRCTGIEHFLLKIISDLPDMDLVINTRDYPQSSIHFGGPLPVFSFSKTPQYYDITYPAWAFWEGGPAISLYPRGLGRWDEHRVLLNKTSAKIPWKGKEDKAFFRGSRTSSERDNLILLSRNKPDLVDAQYTKNQAWKSDEDTLYLPPAPEVPLEKHCLYKYLFNYRGVAASFRHKHLFLCHSLVFHVGDEWTEFYYHAMIPWVHYIPVPQNADQEELEDLIRFAKDNDHLVKKIANRGRNFVWYKLRMKDVICYWKKLLKSYAEILSYKPKLDKTLNRIYKS